MADPFVRRDVWAAESGAPNPPWDAVSLAYARAVGEMRTRPDSDPTSWTYQAGVHGSTSDPPAGATWNQCQHGGWFFLPWHRLYLYYFERIVRSVVVSQGGPADWALPYWNYEASDGARALPPAFRELTLPDGSANPLYVAQRDETMNQGGLLDPSVVSSADALGSLSYSPQFRVPGFGGTKTNGPQHFDQRPGLLEVTPHNAVHGQLGGADPGQNGWMGDPNFAAQDPIFWLHHANIDRLWAAWLALGSGRAEPSDPSWLGQGFDFHDEQGGPQRKLVSDALDTLGQLGYSYDTPAPTGIAAVSEFPEPERPPELVAASQRPVTLTGGRLALEVSVDQRTLAARGREGLVAPAGRAYLAIEDVEAERNHGMVYGVYLNPPAAASPEAGTGRLVGTVSFFGIEKVRRGGDDDAHGFQFLFDVTDAIGALRHAGVWDDSAFGVAFEPLRPQTPPGLVAPAVPAGLAPVRIGRVSLFYE